MTTDWAALREQITRDRGTFCEICGCAKFTELHHSLIHRMKNFPELDSIYNLQAVCSDCHPYANGYKIRCRFWKSQVKLYGHDRMVEWLDGLNLKVPLRFE